MIPYVSKCKNCGKRIGLIKWIKGFIEYQRKFHKIWEETYKENKHLPIKEINKKVKERALISKSS